MPFLLESISFSQFSFIKHLTKELSTSDSEQGDLNGFVQNSPLIWKKVTKPKRSENMVYNYQSSV